MSVRRLYLICILPLVCLFFFFLDAIYCCVPEIACFTKEQRSLDAIYAISTLLESQQQTLTNLLSHIALVPPYEGLEACDVYLALDNFWIGTYDL